jgi:mono/diheme cytochrome c family protein
MKRFTRLAILTAAPWLMAAIWMDEQPAYKPYKPPILAPPKGSVPVTGKEIVSREAPLRNPVPATAESLAQGKTLFDINCAMCHGHTSAERGPVGKKLTPPPPGLDHELLQSLGDADIFKAITFGFGRMPPFQEKLTPQERWNLVNYLRTRK